MSPAVTTLKRSATIFYELGNYLYNLKSYENALLAYEQVIQLEPDHDKVHTQKGRTLFALKRYVDARDAYYKNKPQTLGKMTPYSWGWGKDQPDFWER
jgi:tetratricopeptide (TPR) repeat protein